MRYARLVHHQSADPRYDDTTKIRFRKGAKPFSSGHWAVFLGVFCLRSGIGEGLQFASPFRESAGRINPQREFPCARPRTV